AETSARQRICSLSAPSSGLPAVVGPHSTAFQLLSQGFPPPSTSLGLPPTSPPFSDLAAPSSDLSPPSNTDANNIPACSDGYGYANFANDHQDPPPYLFASKTDPTAMAELQLVLLGLTKPTGSRLLMKTATNDDISPKSNKQAASPSPSPVPPKKQPLKPPRTSVKNPLRAHPDRKPFSSRPRRPSSASSSSSHPPRAISHTQPPVPQQPTEPNESEDKLVSVEYLERDELNELRALDEGGKGCKGVSGQPPNQARWI
ncbi:hypothetical protein FRC01_002124, partial [Tulasnella sp. 417]